MGRVNLLRATELAALIVNGQTMMGRPVPPVSIASSRPAKKCLVCQAPHQHNNAFCSAQCSRVYGSRTGQR